MSKARYGAHALLGAVMMATLVASTPGCASKFTDYCDKSQGCIGGNDKDKAACVTQADEAKATAAAYGCGAEFDAVADCEIASATCQSGKFSSGTACKLQALSLGLCECQASARGAKGQCGSSGGVTPGNPPAAGVDCNQPSKCSGDPAATDASRKACEDEKAGKCSGQYATVVACATARQTCGADNKTNNSDKLSQECGTELNGYLQCKLANPTTPDAGR